VGLLLKVVQFTTGQTMLFLFNLAKSEAPTLGKGAQARQAQANLDRTREVSVGRHRVLNAYWDGLAGIAAGKANSGTMRMTHRKRL